MNPHHILSRLYHCTIRGVAVCLFLPLVACSGGDQPSTSTPTTQVGTPGAEEALGERLFLETRFAQAFKVFLDNGGNINDPDAGDVIVDTLETIGAPIDPGPFKNKSMNCRACHLVDDVLATPGGGMRTYADFARRSPIPARADGKTHAPRNSPPLVNSTLQGPDGILLHFDAEFSSIEELIAATFTGRNFGWLPGERAQAISHIAKVLRGDDGIFDLTDTGLSYRMVFAGLDNSIPVELRLPAEFRVSFVSGSDQELFDAVVRVVAAYVNGLRFSQTTESGAPIRSPFTVFLSLNGLPQQPDSNESPLAYSRRLRTLINDPGFSPKFVTSNPNRTDERFEFHTQAFEFGATELAGLKIFLAEPSTIPASAAERADGKIGNCTACHAAPHFTDFNVHNTGTTQREYDAIHGSGRFSKLSIPDLTTRNRNYNQFLPATEIHPAAMEPFRTIPSASNPALTDLGLWNVFANPDIPGPQATLRALLCDNQQPCLLSDAVLLDRSIARFKTPGLHDLGHSAPFMHNGQFDTLEQILDFYRDTSDLQRATQLRNGDRELGGIALTTQDVAPLAAFLNALNEDYQ